MNRDNLQVRMRSHPQGMVSEDDFTFDTGPVPTPQEGEALVRVSYLSLDPYMRPRMDPVRSYVEPLSPGDLMPGATLGEVIESREPALPKGTLVVAPLGWQSYGLVTKTTARIVDPEAGPPTAALSVLGMTGVTAHYGMMQLIGPGAGDTVVVSAASGAVGGIAGQIARLQGARVVGIAGGPDKCRYVTDVLGFDACLDYKRHDFAEQLDDATPNFVDGLFENVGGPIFDAVLHRVADHARIALCGNISQYNVNEPYGVTGIRELLMHRVQLTGFVIADHAEHWPTALADLSAWLRDERITYREDIAAGGLQQAPKAFIGMLTGQNFGKQLVEVGPEGS